MVKHFSISKHLIKLPCHNELYIYGYVLSTWNFYFSSSLSPCASAENKSRHGLVF